MSEGLQKWGCEPCDYLETIPGRGHHECKGPEVGTGRVFRRNRKDPVKLAQDGSMKVRLNRSH